MQLTGVHFFGRACRGFTLTEMAVVFAIVALLMGGAMMTLSAQIEQRNQTETRRRLDAAVEALLGFAIVNRRLPCPATITGDEAINLPGTSATGGTCATNFNGFLPARTIGFQPVDSQGYGLDAWDNRIRYVVSSATPTGCTNPPTTPPFTSVANLKANGVSCLPSDIDICVSAAPPTSATSCNSSANRVVTLGTVALIVFSTGKNGSIPGAQGPDELANTDNNQVFVSRLPGTTETGGGAYDDVTLWVPVGVLYSRLISAGVLP
jgi:prepilin-type N-terminal cleavage/methylation domain-containing protein